MERKLDYTTTVINMLGGPGSGKSTNAAELYAKMKRESMHVELVREVAKEWVWQGHYIGPFEQMSILGKQIQRESSLFGKVEYIVTDSPALLGAFYCQKAGQGFMTDMVYHYYKYSEVHGVRFLNYMVPRKEKYDPKGRFESEEQSKEIDTQLQDYMNLHEFSFKRFTTSDDLILRDLK